MEELSAAKAPDSARRAPKRKTWLLEDFGKNHYRNTVSANFDLEPSYKSLFQNTKDPKTILSNLSVSLGQRIAPGETLIIFDEIQECPQALSSLKHFQERYPQYHVACAGSMLGIRTEASDSFPVGKVDFLSVYPMTFLEYLEAVGEELLREYIEGLSAIEEVPEPIFVKLENHLKHYFILGGFPESISAWTTTQDPQNVEQVLSNLLNAYDLDFRKHLNPTAGQRVSRVWESIPAQLAKENAKFKYKLVHENANGRDYEEAIDWLTDARLVHRVNRCKGPALPMSLNEEERAFKLYCADVGLLRKHAKIAPSAFLEGAKLFAEYRGSLTENFILQTLTARYDSSLMYWASHNPAYELDFLWQHGNFVLPAEVKAGRRNTRKALAVYQKLYADKTPIRVRYSMLNLHLKDNLLNIPLFLADKTPELIDLALKQL